MSSGWSALSAFVLGAVITNVQWAIRYYQHLREDCPQYHGTTTEVR